MTGKIRSFAFDGALALWHVRLEAGASPGLEGLAERKTSGQGFVLAGDVPTEIINDIATDFDALLNAAGAGKYPGVERFTMTKLTKPGLVEKYFD